MSSSSMIPLAPGLSEEWTSFLAPASTSRLIKIVINLDSPQSLLVDSVHPKQGNDVEDWELFKLDGLVSPLKAAYSLYRLDSPTTASKDIVFIAYIPDIAPVRTKMIYASTKLTLIKGLPRSEERFSTTILATSPNDLNHLSYLSHLRHNALAAPLTQREIEMNAIKVSEEEMRTSLEKREPRSILHGMKSVVGGKSVVGMKWSDEAGQALEEMKKGGKAVVRLLIEPKKELIDLATAPSDELVIPQDVISLTFYRLVDERIVFIYCCPPTSPIRSRMIYSSSIALVVESAQAYGVEVVKKLETSSPEEMTPAFILSEIGPAPLPAAIVPTSPLSALDSATEGGLGGHELDKDKDNFIPSGFSRPSRPGRAR